MEDLWPKKFGVDIKKSSAVSILRLQGTYLGKRTDGIVDGIVETRMNDIDTGDNVFAFNFCLRSLALAYRYKILSIHYPIELLPVTVVVDDDIKKELPEVFRDTPELVANTEQEYQQILASIFATSKVKRIIDGILSSVSDVQEEQRSNYIAPFPER